MKFAVHFDDLKKDLENVFCLKHEIRIDIHIMAVNRRVIGYLIPIVLLSAQQVITGLSQYQSSSGRNG